MTKQKKVILQLRAAKKEKRWTYRQLGDATGVTGQYVEMLMSGRTALPVYKTAVIDSLKKILLPS
jgi:transcriptional regulator with XRE-family HTH domain